jgi:membrane-associated phospholipid phosphatase
MTGRGRFALPPLLIAAAFAATILFGIAIPRVPALTALNVSLFHAVNGLSCGVTADNPVFWLMWTGMNQPLNNYIVLYAIAAFYVLYFKRWEWRRLVFVGLAIAAIGFISNLIIWIWAWGPRPFTQTDACILYPEWKEIWSQYSSYPSGHARETAAEVTFITTFWPRFLPFGVAYLLLLCFSRLYIGVHFPLDVAVGAVLGWAIARIAFLSYDVYATRLLARLGWGRSA